MVLSGTYRIERRIGHGGMGDVYLASHARLPGRFAVKILLPELIGNQEAFARFCREAEIMSQLRHPNIVQIFDFDAAPDGRPYFVMEYLEGRDLETRLFERFRAAAADRGSHRQLDRVGAGDRPWPRRRPPRPQAGERLPGRRRRPDRRGREGARLRDLQGAVGGPALGKQGPRSARRPTWPPNRPAAITTPSTDAPISSRWAR